MLSKRLYKKTSFVILMLIVPICILAFSFVAKQSGGFIHIVLAQTDSNDKISSEVIKELMEKDSLIQFTTANSDKDALLEVEKGLADEAWIFAADTQVEFGLGQPYMIDSIQEEHGYVIDGVFPVGQNAAQSHHQLPFMLIEIGKIIDIRLIIHFEQQAFQDLSCLFMGGILQIFSQDHIQPPIADEHEAFHDNAQMPEPEQLHRFPEGIGGFFGNFPADIGDDQQPFLFLPFRLKGKLLCIGGIAPDQGA